MMKPERRFAQENSREFRDGDCIFSEGDVSREMFVVQYGEVTISKRLQNGEQVLLATMRRGDFFGEMALLESLPRSASAHAHGETKLLVLQPGGFLLKIRRDPTFAFEMLQHLCHRIRHTNEQLLEALNAGVNTLEHIKAILNGSEFGGNPQGEDA